MKNMKIKNIFMICVLIMSILLVISLSNASVYDYDWIDITLISQSPDPVEPGDTVDVKVKVQNLGGSAVNNFKFEIMPEYPFSLYNPDDRLKELSSLTAGDDYGIVYKYEIKVDEDAVEGTNKLKFRHKYGSGSWVTLELNIDIQSPDAIILIKDVRTEPEVVSHGEKAVLNFKLKNLADSLLKDVSLDLDLSSSSLPISPLHSGTEKKIKSIKAGEEKDISFEIITLATADSKVHKVPLDLIYYDELGEKYNKTDIVSIIVSSKPDLSYYVDGSEVLVAGTSGKVTIKLVNKGSEDIKFVNVKLKDCSDFVKLSTDEIYLGNVDSDDYETADFNLYVEKKVSNLKLPVIIEYRDSINRVYKDEVELPLVLYDARDAKKYNLIKGNGYAGILVIIIIAVGGFFIYRRYKKRKKK